MTVNEILTWDKLLKAMEGMKMPPNPWEGYWIFGAEETVEQMIDLSFENGWEAATSHYNPRCFVVFAVDAFDLDERGAGKISSITLQAAKYIEPGKLFTVSPRAMGRYLDV